MTRSTQQIRADAEENNDAMICDLYEGLLACAKKQELLSSELKSTGRSPEGLDLMSDFIGSRCDHEPSVFQKVFRLLKPEIDEINKRTRSAA